MCVCVCMPKVTDPHPWRDREIDDRERERALFKIFRIRGKEEREETRKEKRKEEREEKREEEYSTGVT